MEDVKMDVWVVKGIENVIKANPKRLDDLLRNLKNDKELFEEIVISAYVEGLISLSKASELLEITRDEMVEILKKKGIPIRMLNKEDVIAEVEAVRWF
jgi:predicted HTH domain antitoxin